VDGTRVSRNTTFGTYEHQRFYSLWSPVG
jgi:hypothetical protein